MNDEIIPLNLEVQIIFYEKEMKLSQLLVNQKERITTAQAENILTEQNILFDNVLKITRQKIIFDIPFDELVNYDFKIN